MRSDDEVDDAVVRLSTLCRVVADDWLAGEVAECLEILTSEIFRLRTELAQSAPDSMDAEYRRMVSAAIVGSVIANEQNYGLMSSDELRVGAISDHVRFARKIVKLWKRAECELRGLQR